jgi:hypothetical protein
MADATDPNLAPDRATLIVRMSRAEYAELAAAAEQDGRSIAGLVRRLIRLHVSTPHRTRQLSPETLRQIEQALGA